MIHYEEALILLVLNKLSKNDLELADYLKVPLFKIERWKKGEYIPKVIEDQLNLIIKIGDRNPIFVFWAGGLEQSIYWEKLIAFLSRVVNERTKDYGNSELLCDIDELFHRLCFDIFYVLKEMGINMPHKFPEQLKYDYDNINLADSKVLYLIKNNVYSNIIYEIFISYTKVYRFFDDFIADVIYDDRIRFDNIEAEDIHAYLMDLAALNVEVNSKFATNIEKFRQETEFNFKKWLTAIETKAKKAAIPLNMDLLNLIRVC